MSAADATAMDAPTATTGSLEATARERTAQTREKLDEVAEAKRRANEMADEGHSREEIRAELKQNMNLQGAVLTVVVAGATAYAGINVMSSIGESMTLSSGDMFYNSSMALEEGVNSFFTNLPTVFVVIALVLIIGYLTILR